MIASMIIIRRLFSSRPSSQELSFHWWFAAAGGIKVWHTYLASRGLTFSRRSRIIREQERASRKILEVWDTARFHHWRDTGEHPAINTDILNERILPVARPSDVQEIHEAHSWKDRPACTAAGNVRESSSHSTLSSSNH